ncbi:gp071 [Rhodococcus phage ReqiDocB7]|uniref:gp071 n=1 Tax=Rhodococcus phage ReqiDocB7 TaxID=691966 RepID=UPI0001CDD860|nr:gp071 [Rhodococcus phage ReqiDocB7]ADD80857.1 gp071 [Rhodococcus phage ReqiDocB7]
MSDDREGLQAPDAEPDPVHNDNISCHDIVIAGMYLRTFGAAQTGHSDIQAAFIADMKARKEFGLKKYGTALQPHNGRNAIKDAYDEAMDLCVYLAQGQTEGVELRETLDKVVSIAVSLKARLMHQEKEKNNDSATQSRRTVPGRPDPWVHGTFAASDAPDISHRGGRLRCGGDLPEPGA